MTVARNYGQISFECDACGDVLDTGMSEFNEALSYMKREGWKVIRTATRTEVVWEHHCSDCEDKA